MNGRAVVFMILVVTGMALATDLPKDDFSPGWRKHQAALVFSQKDLYGYIDGGAELFLEFGFSELVVQRYRRNHLELSLDIYKMANADAALAVYLAKKGVEQPVPGVLARNTGGEYQITALQGRYFVQVNNQSGEAENLTVMVPLLQQFLQHVKDEPPQIRWQDFPENRIPGSELLIAGPYSLQMVYTLGEGDILQLANRPFAMCAQVADEAGNKHTVIRAVYGDSVLARDVMQNLSAHLDEYLTKISVSADTLIFRDYKNEYGRIVRKADALEVQLHLHQIKAARTDCR